MRRQRCQNCLLSRVVEIYLPITRSHQNPTSGVYQPAGSYPFPAGCFFEQIMEKMSKDFDWNSKDFDSVCIHRVNAIAVYQDGANEIVIRQENDYGNEDSLVIIPPEHIDTLIAKLKEVQKEIEMNLKTTTED